MNRLLASLCVLSFSLVLGGCPIYGDRGGSGPGFCVGEGCPCDAIDDCSEGFRCDVRGGMCELAPSCVRDSDCPSGEVCDLGFNVCVPGAPVTPCRTDGDCAVGAYCADGACAPSGTCSADTDCTTTGFVCDFRDTCVPAGACRSTADCSGSDVCVEGDCRAPSSTCQFNYECGAGRACVDNACVNLCTSAAQCASGQACRGGFCEADTSECTASAQCSGGEYCVGGRCLADCRSATCSSASDACGVDAFCRPSWEPRPFCASDADCEGGSVCRDGVCRTPCPTGTNMECMRFDVQFTLCQAAPGGSESLCYTANERTPECAQQSECATDERCVDAICRNR